MQVTNLHDTYDDVPRAVKGVSLIDDQLQNYYGDDLRKIMQQHDTEPITRRISRETPFDPHFNGPIAWLKVHAHDWRLRKRMQENDYNFAYMQLGSFIICYDFYRL